MDILSFLIDLRGRFPTRLNEFPGSPQTNCTPPSLKWIRWPPPPLTDRCNSCLTQSTENTISTDVVDVGLLQVGVRSLDLLHFMKWSLKAHSKKMTVRRSRFQRCVNATSRGSWLIVPGHGLWGVTFIDLQLQLPCSGAMAMSGSWKLCVAAVP